MDLIHPQLAAFAAVLEEGSFEAAARRLSVTPSAVSQRIKVLEDRLGQVLVARQAPCRPTPAGERLLRRVRPMLALEAEALADFLPEGSTDASARTIAIAVNDDSLETWFVAALARLHRQHGYLFDVRVDDQDHTLDLLRDGSVLGAVTAEAKPLQGCNVHALGTMRYRAIASPEFAARYFSGGVDAAALAHAPMIVFNRKDALQWRFVRRITRARLAPPVHYLPTATGFVDAAARGLGWCLAPESLIEPALHAKRIVIVDPSRWLDVPLYWQYAAVRSSTLQKISQLMREAAASALRT
ncbi:LysR family transcriptional regulator ArgP [Marilutibacter alkalisoli]|uniref:LysR family transcriptional regulator ArgP n=1 Tax=Marilutibacter alkalisoli TaxID=2591633 RepID=A0A514BNG9_9GAMM|nr:LysR family transcriptional regulator ArgP [Lysobacter alkalisoli]QDH68922.1 LysR family transcriptional regulator ArgP [Lysobacter alkalisoli]